MADNLQKKRRELRARKFALNNCFNNLLNKDMKNFSINYLREVVAQTRYDFTRLRELQNSIIVDITELQSIGEDIVDDECEKQSSQDTLFNDRIHEYLSRVTEIIELKSSVNNAGSSSAPPNPPPHPPPHPPQSPFNLKLPELKISTFTDNSRDPFEFFRFISTFNNSLNSVAGVTKSVKLVYLKSYCRGRALALIENFPIEDDSFDPAMALLEAEFLDKDLLINKTLSDIVNFKPCSCLDSSMEMLTFLKSKIAELRRFGIRFSPGTSGEVLLSNIIRE